MNHRTQSALIKGSDLGNVGTGRPGEVGYTPADPSTFDNAARGSDSAGWIARPGEESRLLTDHGVFGWVDPSSLLKS